jgi:adenine/guanine phosphoribosyltransferase-like PRPP-binding protein
MIAACDLLTNIGAVIVDCAVMVELKALGGSAKLQAKYPSVTVWSMLDESLLQRAGVIADDSQTHSSA